VQDLAELKAAGLHLVVCRLPSHLRGTAMQGAAGLAVASVCGAPAQHAWQCRSRQLAGRGRLGGTAEAHPKLAGVVKVLGFECRGKGRGLVWRRGWSGGDTLFQADQTSATQSLVNTSEGSSNPWQHVDAVRSPRPMQAGCRWGRWSAGMRKAASPHKACPSTDRHQGGVQLEPTCLRTLASPLQRSSRSLA